MEDVISNKITPRKLIVNPSLWGVIAFNTSVLKKEPIKKYSIYTENITMAHKINVLVVSFLIDFHSSAEIQ